MNIQEWLEKHNFTYFDDKSQYTLVLTSIKIFENPHNKDNEWSKGANHYQCQLSVKGKGAKDPFVFFYSQGSAHTRAPKLWSVLESFASDIQCSGETFKDFCDNCGYSTDSISARQTYDLIQDQSLKLLKLLGRPAFEDLLNVEW